MQTALLLLSEEHRTDSALLIFGENHPKVLDYFESKGITLEELAHSREFRSFHLSLSGKKHLLVLAGMGSASVEVVLSELSMLGVENIVLTGSCGASYDHELGSAKILSEASPNNAGAIRYYGKDGGVSYDPDSSLLDLASELGLAHAKMLSSDAFYGYGCLLDENRVPVYVGGRAKEEPIGFKEFRDLYLSGASYLIDMEVAYVYALAETFGLKAIAIKGVSNYVPFEIGNFISKEDEAMDNCMSASLQVLERIG